MFFFLFLFSLQLVNVVNAKNMYKKNYLFLLQ